MPLRMIIQDIQIEYYRIMSRIAQSQRKNSPMTNTHLDAFDELSISEKIDGHTLNIPIEKSEYEKKSSVVAG